MLKIAPVVVPFAILWIVLGLLTPMPSVSPDEFLYHHLAWSLAHGEGLTWRGGDQSLRAALYVYLLTPAALLSSTAAAYDVQKVVSILLVCCTAFPTWYLGRRVLPARVALLAVALVLCASWMVSSSSLLTESLALPLATASLVAAVEAFRRPSSRALWAAIGFAALATWARAQLAVLGPVLVVAVFADVLRQEPAARRERLRLHGRALALMAAAVACAVLVYAVGGRDALGLYGGVVDFRPSGGDLLSRAGQEATLLAALSGFLPLLLLAVLTVRPAAWRDAVTGPMLAVLVPAVVLFVLQAAWFVVGVDLPWAIQRYAEYPAPVMIVLCLAAVGRRELVGPRTLAAAAVLGLALLATPAVRERTEERAVFGIVERVNDLVPHISTGVAVAVVAVVVCAIAALASRRPGAAGGTPRGPVVVGVVLLALFVAQSATGWTWQHRNAVVSRNQQPADLEWVTRHSHGPVAALGVNFPSPSFIATEWFNPTIDRYYMLGRRAPVAGRSCTAHIDGPTGRVAFEPGCPPQGDTFLVSDAGARLHFHNEVASTSGPNGSRLVRLSGPPRLLSEVDMPCLAVRPAKPVSLDPAPSDAVPCTPQLQVELWLDRPALLELTFAGGAEVDHLVQLGVRSYTIRSGRPTTVPIRVPAGGQQVTLGLDWGTAAAGDPRLTGARLGLEGRTIDLL
jgi:hypothetical protein